MTSLFLDLNTKLHKIKAEVMAIQKNYVLHPDDSDEYANSKLDTLNVKLDTLRDITQKEQFELMLSLATEIDDLIHHLQTEQWRIEMLKVYPELK